MKLKCIDNTDRLVALQSGGGRKHAIVTELIAKWLYCL